MFSTFQGEFRMDTQQVVVRSNIRGDEKPLFDIDRGNVNLSAMKDSLSHDRTQISDRRHRLSCS